MNLPGVGTDFIKKPAVVSDHQQTARVLAPAAFQMMRKPGNCLHIQVVSGLIQHEHIPFLYQQSRQGHAATLPARERRNRRIPGQIRH